MQSPFPGMDPCIEASRPWLASPVNLLAIDPLRGGEQPPLLKPVPPAPYYIVLARADSRPEAEVWPVQLADALPRLPVPLRLPFPDVALDLGAAVSAVYRRAGYGACTDYSAPPSPPPFSPEETAWAETRWRDRSERS